VQNSFQGVCSSVHVGILKQIFALRERRARSLLELWSARRNAGLMLERISAIDLLSLVVD